MKFLKSLQSICFAHFLIISTFAQSSGSEPIPTPERQTTGYLYGGGMMLRDNIYKGADVSPLVIPLLGYRGTHLKVFGPFASYDFVEQGPITLFAQFAPRFQGFKASDSDGFEGMATRKKALEAGLGYKIKFDRWQLQGSTLSELFGTSDGTEIKTTLSRQFRHGPFLMTPKISVSYLSNDHVDYYYGVRSNEATASRPVYRGIKTTNQAIGFTVATPIFFKGMSRFTMTNTWLGTEIRNSPLVDKTSYLSSMLTFTRFF